MPPILNTMHSFLSQIAACYNHIQRTFHSTRQVEEKVSQSLIKLCGELYDQDAGQLQLKVLRYVSIFLECNDDDDYDDDNDGDDDDDDDDYGGDDDDDDDYYYYYYYYGDDNNDDDDDDDDDADDDADDNYGGDDDDDDD
ncbi:hypothetical protein ACF0H5_011292 [Mactra antiquata]